MNAEGWNPPLRPETDSSSILVVDRTSAAVGCLLRNVYGPDSVPNSSVGFLEVGVFPHVLLVSRRRAFGTAASATWLRTLKSSCRDTDQPC